MTSCLLRPLLPCLPALPDLTSSPQPLSLMQVCNTKCSSATADTCRPLKSVSVGATGVTAYPTASSDACGPSFGAGALGSLATAAPSGPENCEALYLTANKPSATLAEVCANGCPVLFTLDNGATYSTTVDGAAVPSPSPSSSPSGGSSPSSSSPKPYGPSPYRRRSLQEEAARGLFQQGRRLTQYGRRL